VLLVVGGRCTWPKRSATTGVDPTLPTTFGYHEVFHAYVYAAATCQYIAITIFIG
jgi:predicted membrane channel-forming protein YqfA (hemolysin III family)